MKDFKKEDDLFICEECNGKFHKKDKLVYHINKKHFGVKAYYDKWLKETGEGLCKICNKETEFTDFKYYYKKCCSAECTNKYRYNETKNTVFLKYGVNNASENKVIKNRIKTTWNNKTEEEKHIIRKRIENTCELHYGTTNNMSVSSIKNKVRETWDKKSIEENNDIKQRRKSTLQNTLKEKYGVENVSQVIEFFEKSQHKQLKLHQFRNTHLNYQSSYELDFLEKYFDKYPDIQRGPTIRYEYETKNKVYYPDFYIPSLNLIIECKNKNLYLRDYKKIKAKEIFTVKNGYNYIIIIEKDYTNINL